LGRAVRGIPWNSPGFNPCAREARPGRPAYNPGVSAGSTRWISALALAGLFGSACVGPLERGESLYRQGDVRGAIELWRAVPEDDPAHAQVDERLAIVRSEFEKLLVRYEKRGSFFEKEGRLAEAVLDYRLALELDPERPELLDRVQVLVRRLDKEKRAERAALQKALDSSRLVRVKRHADRLAVLDPFDPSLQIEIRRARAATGGRILSHLETGKRAYAAANHIAARAAFKSALALDENNQTALGYLSFIRRFDELELEGEPPPPPISLPDHEILAEGHFRAADIAEQSGRSFRALKEYDSALVLNPDHKRARAASEALRRKLTPQVDELYVVGARYFKDEDLQNALRVWQRLLLINPEHERTRENVARAERMLTRLEELRTDGS